MLAVLVSPLPVGAQNDTEDASTADTDPRESVRGPQRWHPEAYAGSAESSSTSSVLVLDAGEAGLEISPGPSPVSTAEDRASRAKAGVAVSCIFVGIGAAVIAAGIIGANNTDDLGSAIGMAAGLGTLGGIAVVGGLVGAGISGRKLSLANQERRDLEKARRQTSRRLQWDPRKMGLVF